MKFKHRLVNLDQMQAVMVWISNRTLLYIFCILPIALQVILA